jgi:hypothetical protein
VLIAKHLAINTDVSKNGNVDVDAFSLADYFRFFVKEVKSSPLYVAMCPILADNEQAMAIVSQARPTQQRPNLLLAAMHASLLRNPSHPLAAWYRSCDGTRSPDDSALASAVDALLNERHNEILALVETGATQTNEPGRSAVLVPALAAVHANVRRPIGLVEVGASAGLNLRLDNYQYTYQFAESALATGPSNAPVHIRCDMTRSESRFDPTTLRDLTIGSRVGVDLNPLDVNDEAQSRWLRALVWPDEVARFQRLSAAIEQGKQHPVIIHAGDAVESLAQLIADVPANQHPVIVTTWVLTYLPEDRRVAFVELVDRLGATRPLSWVWIEHPAYASGLRFPPEVWADVASEGNPVVVSTYDGLGRSTQQLVAVTHPHGTWLNWVE